MQYYTIVDALFQRCSASKSSIPPEFIAKLSKEQNNLFDSLCPPFSFDVAKPGTQISKMGNGRIVGQMVEAIAATEGCCR